jgi:heptosyltransferase III
VNAHDFKNVLIVRTDRIGDVVLTLPMVPAIHSKFPGRRVSMLLRTYTRDLVEGFEGLETIISYDAKGELKGFFQLLGEVKAGRFDLVFAVHPTFRIALLMFLAGIPARVGTGYRWYSFLFNRRVFEHRKTAERHEAEYNLSLLRAVGCDIRSIPSITMPVTEAARDAAAREIQRLGLTTVRKLVILHPGSGGSARDWSPGNFGLLAKELKNDGYDVVITGSADEQSLVSEVVRLSEGNALAADGRLSLKELTAFIRQAQLFVSNSTGPLHIAASAGVPVIAFYPPMQACSPRRWGPLTDKKAVFVADNKICERCKGGACQGNDCMDQITVDHVVRAARHLLSGGEKKAIP